MFRVSCGDTEGGWVVGGAARSKGHAWGCSHSEARTVEFVRSDAQLLCPRKKHMFCVVHLSVIKFENTRTNTYSSATQGVLTGTKTLVGDGKSTAPRHKWHCAELVLITKKHTHTMHACDENRCLVYPASGSVCLCIVEQHGPQQKHTVMAPSKIPVRFSTCQGSLRGRRTWVAERAPWPSSTCPSPSRRSSSHRSSPSSSACWTAATPPAPSCSCRRRPHRRSHRHRSTRGGSSSTSSHCRQRRLLLVAGGRDRGRGGDGCHCCSARCLVVRGCRTLPLRRALPISRQIRRRRDYRHRRHRRRHHLRLRLPSRRRRRHRTLPPRRLLLLRQIPTALRPPRTTAFTKKTAFGGERERERHAHPGIA